MEKAFKTILLCILAVLFFCSCSQASQTALLNSENKTSPDAKAAAAVVKGQGYKIPCITYHEEQGQIKAKLASWDITAGKLELTGKEVYSFPSDISYRVPNVWDGKGKIIIPDYAKLSKNYMTEGKTIKSMSSEVEEIIFGENIQVTKIRDQKSGVFQKYKITAFNGKNKSEKEVKFDYQYKDSQGKKIPIDENGDVSAVYYNGKEAVLAFVRTPRDGFSIFMVKYNMSTGAQKWSEIKIPDDAMDFQSMPMPNTIDNIGGKIYCQTIHGIGMLDTSSEKFYEMNEITKKCNSIVKSTKKDEIPRYFVIKGCYGDISIFGVPVNTGAQNENLYCAFRGNTFLGALYVSGNTINVIDSNNKVKARLDIKANKMRTDVMFAFPRKNGNNWS